mgnify:CR=1 FL=1
MANFVIRPTFGLGGVDLVIDEPSMPPFLAREAKNFVKYGGQTGYRRPGYKLFCLNDDNNGGFGTFIRHPEGEDAEILIVGSKLFRVLNYSLEITYSGSSVALCEFLVDETADSPTWIFKLFEGGTAVLTVDCGVGFDEATTVTMTSLASSISGVSGFSATLAPPPISGVGSLNLRRSIVSNFLGLVEPLPDNDISAVDRRHMSYLYRGDESSSASVSPTAVLLDALPRQQLVDNFISIPFSLAEEVNQPTGAVDPFEGAFNNRNTDDFENVTAIEDGGVVYFASRYDEQKKYDGVDCFRAGCPQATDPVAIGAGSGTLSAGTRQYAAIIVQVDATGRRTEGIESASIELVTASNTDITLTLTNVLATSGFNTDCGICDGGATTTNTIDVDDGSGGAHTLKLGQTAYFYDSVSGAYVEREIIEVDATSITVSGDAVTVADGAVISNNLRIMILKSADASSTLRRWTEIPNNSFTATQDFLDDVEDNDADFSAAPEFTSPSLLGLEHGLPPKAGYITMHQDAPVIAGMPDAPNYFAWAIRGYPEYWPSLFQDYVTGALNKPITAIASSGSSLDIHKEDKTWTLSGTMAIGVYTVTPKGGAIGCRAHATIQEVETSVVWLGSGGVYESVDGAIPVCISDAIAPIFEEKNSDDEKNFSFRRAIGIYDKHRKLYMLYLPAESTSNGRVYPNDNSETWVYNVRLKEWYGPWTGLNFAGGAGLIDKDLYWTERRLSTYDSNMAYQVYRRLNTGGRYDFVDHVSDIPWSYIPGWVHDNQRSSLKKFPSIKVWTSDPEKVAFYVLDVTTERDFLSGVSHSRLSVDVGSSGSTGWAISGWGLFPWGSPAATQNKARKLKPGSCGSLRPTFKASGIYSEVILAGYELEIVAPYDIRMKDIKTS